MLHFFKLHCIEAPTAHARDVDDVPIVATRAGKLLTEFALDVSTLTGDIDSSQSGSVSRIIAPNGSIQLTYDASHSEFAVIDGDTDVESVTFPEEATDSEENVCTYIGNDDSSAVLNRNRSSEGTGQYAGIRKLKHGTLSLTGGQQSHVRFATEIHEIPTIHQLQHDVYRAIDERTRLSQSVDNLSIHLFRMVHEIEDMKGNIEQLTELVSCQIRNSIAVAKRSRLGNIKKRRRVVLDGHSLGSEYGGGHFKAEGIGIALAYYIKQDVNVMAVAPESKLRNKAKHNTYGNLVDDMDGLKQFLENGLVSLTSSKSEGRFFLLKYAVQEDADIISNYSFRAEVCSQETDKDRKDLQTFLQSHCIPFSFIGNKFIPNPKPTKILSSEQAPARIRRSDTV